MRKILALALAGFSFAPPGAVPGILPAIAGTVSLARLAQAVPGGTALPASLPAAALPPGVLTNYLVGHVAEDMGDYSEAAARFEAVLAKDPHNAHALDEGFDVSALSGGPATVALARQLPNNPLAIMVVGNDQLAAGQWDQAAAIYARLPETGAFALMRPVLQAWCDAGAGRTLAALQNLQQAAQGSPIGAIYLLHAALIADRAGRPDDARELYRASQDEMPQPTLRFALAQASFLARSGQANTARGMLTDLLTNVPQDRMALPRLLAQISQPLISTPQQGVAEFYDAVGNDLVREAATNAQAAMLSRVFVQYAVTLRPDLTDARLAAASEDQSAGRYDLARAMLAPVTPADPLDPLVRLARGEILDQSGNTDQALAGLAAVAADYPQYPEPFEIMGDIDRNRGRSADAVKAYDQAISRSGSAQSLHGADWVLLLDRAEALQDAGNWPAAEADLQTALRISPNEPALLNFLGYSWADQNRNLPQARDLLERAVKLSPRDGAILDSLGWVKFRQGDVADAVATLEAAVQMMPEDPDVNTHLGDAYEAVGRRLEARYQWQYALTLNPSSEAAARLRAKLASVETLSAARAVTP